MFGGGSLCIRLSPQRSPALIGSPPRSPSLSKKAPSHPPDGSRRPTQYASLGDRRRCRLRPLAQTPRGESYPSSGGCVALDTAVACGEVLGDTLKRGGGGGPRRSAIWVGEKGCSGGVSYREERHLHSTPTPVSSASHGKRLELPKGGVHLNPLPFLPASRRK